MLIFENVLGVGILFFMISITNFWWIGNEIKKYSDGEKEDAMLLMTRIPLEKLIFFRNLSITSIPLLFAGIFSIIYAFSI